MNKAFSRSLSEVVTALGRPRCRIAWGKPGEDGSGWKAATPLPALKLWSPYDLTMPATEVRALAGEEEFFVRFDCGVENPAALRPLSSRGSITENEHVFFQIMPQNDPTDRWRIAGTFAAGAMKVTHCREINGEASLGGVYDMWRTEIPSAAAAQDIRSLFGIESNRWWMEFIVPWRALGVAKRPPTIGVQFVRGAAVLADDPVLLLASWPEDTRSSSCPPHLEPGEAILGPEAGAPERIELAPPHFGRNRGRVVLGNGWPTRPVCLRVSVERPDSTLRPGGEIAIPRERGFVEFEYELDRNSSSHLEPFRTNTLVIEVLGAGPEEVLYHARLPMDRHLGICVDEPYGISLNPSTSGTVRERWLERVVRALPKLMRGTTAQGAPSDFCLMYEDGKPAVNLMDDDPWRALAAIIEERFQSAEDRLVAAMALVGQKSVTNLILDPMFFNVAGAHSYHSPHHELMGPVSIMRYGGGSAVCRAAVLAGLLQRVADLSTGSPFTTRVISLSFHGGPRQVKRRYAACSGLAPFVQEPGRVGAVAVDYADGQTLLDPTALAFFPVSEGTLASIEQIASDEAVRHQGADRLASVYGKIDIEEIRRQPYNRLLSKGVFPELCLDEDGVNRPFVPHQRQVLRVLRPGERLEGFTDFRGHRGHRNGSVSAACGDTGLQLTIRVRGADVGRFNARDREIERVHVVIDPAHGHEHFHHFAAGLAGERTAWLESASGIQTLFKHLSTENHAEICELADATWSAEFQQNGNDGYEVRFVIGWESLGLSDQARRPPVIGLNFWVDGRFPEYEQVFLSPPRWRLPAEPFSFTDLYLSDASLSIHQIDLGVPCWGSNRGEAIIENHGPRNASVTLRTETRLSMRRHLHRSDLVVVNVPAHGSARATFGFHADPEEKMTSGQTLALIAASEDDEWFRAHWRLTYCGPVNVYQRYGPALGRCANPKPGSADFLPRKINFICSRIPEFQRLTTRDGAPSDFSLRATDGSVEFNLMEAGVLDRVAAYVTNLFDNDLDRLLGLFFLSHHPAFARHMSAGHRFMEGADPLSVLRGNFAGGGGNCGYHARVFAGMASHLQSNAKLLTAHTLGIAGHAISAVGWNGSKALLDADVGHLFFKPDGSDLATIEDMRSVAGVLCTAGPGDLTRYVTFQDNPVRHAKTPSPIHFPGAFPPGRPKA